MKTADLIGPDLDAWVARAEELRTEIRMRKGVPHAYIFIDTAVVEGQPRIYSPSTDPSEGQPIMERERITSISIREDAWLAGVEYSLCDAQFYGPFSSGGLSNPSSFGFLGETMLIAGMRARVAQVYGNEVPS